MRVTRPIFTHLTAAIAVVILNGSALAEEEIVEVTDAEILATVQVDEVSEEAPADPESMDTPPVDSAPPAGAEREKAK